MFRTRLTRVFTVLLLCLSVVTLARAAAAMDAMEYKGYINKVFGYSLQYPDIFFLRRFKRRLLMLHTLRHLRMRPILFHVVDSVHGYHTRI